MNNINSNIQNNNKNNNKNDIANNIVNNNDTLERKGLIIYQKYLELLYYSLDLVRKYPKCEQFALVQEIKNTIYTILKFMMCAIKSYAKHEKLKYLREVDIYLNLLKVQSRISYKYKYISHQNFETWVRLITDICNMLGGWILSCQKR